MIVIDQPESFVLKLVYLSLTMPISHSGLLYLTCNQDPEKVLTVGSNPTIGSQNAQYFAAKAFNG